MDGEQNASFLTDKDDARDSGNIGLSKVVS